MKEQYSYWNALTLRITKTTDWRDGRKIENAKIQNNSVADSAVSTTDSTDTNTAPVLATNKPTRAAKVVQSNSTRERASKNLMHHTVRKNKKQGEKPYGRTKEQAGATVTKSAGSSQGPKRTK